MDVAAAPIEDAKDGSISIKERAPSPSSDNYREEFLAGVDAAEDKRIMRKVDRRFLLLIGLMYMIKNIDYTNAATVKVLQVDQSTNILTQLKMTDDEYNWVQSIYFVCPPNPENGTKLTEGCR